MKSAKYKRKSVTMKKHFFFHQFLRNFVFIMLPILIIGPYFILHYNRLVRQNVEQNTWNMLYQIQENTSTITQAVNNGRLYFRNNSSAIVECKSALKNESLSYSDLSNIQTVSLYLRNLVNTNPYFYSAYIYFNNDNNRFMASDVGLANTSTYFDTDWLTSYQNSDKSIWFEVRELKPYSFSKPTRVISIYQKLVSSLSKDFDAGVLVVQIDCSKLSSYLDSLSLYNNQLICFLDSQGSVLFQNKDTDIQQLNSILESNQEVSDQYKMQSVFYQNEQQILSIFPASDKVSWTSLSLIPSKELYQESFKMMLLYLLVIVAAFLLSLVLAIVSAHKDYSRLEMILDTLNNAGKESLTASLAHPNRSYDPYGYIIKNILEMFIEQNYLRVQVSEKKYKIKLMEMQALQQQINPHFIFNTLHTIYWEALGMTQSSNPCSNMISDLSEIMEYALSKPEERVELQDEINYLEHYLNIQKVRYEDKLDVVWDIDEKAVIYLVPKMILQPLVENAIYHGIKEKPSKSTLKIKVFDRYAHLAIHIVDSGVGMSKDKRKSLQEQLLMVSEPDGHIGLLNTNKRLSFAFEDAYSIQLWSKEGHGTSLILKIPKI
jgi:two-component system, sensor histidine kinase YesM